MSLIVMVVVSMAWCAWLVWDGIQECRKIDGETSHALSRTLEARQ